MKVCIVTLSSSRKAGGLFYSVRHLSEIISQQPGVELTVLTTEDQFTKEDISVWENLNLVTFKRTPNSKFGFSIGLLFFLLRNNYDLIHLHGIWNFSSLAVFINHKIKRTPYIVSPRGMLDQWIFKKNRALKQIFWRLYEKNVIQNASLIHALSASEMESVLSLSVSDRVILSPNGVAATVPNRRNWKKPQKHIIFIGRIDKKKGLLELINAWSQIDILHDWFLDIYGWGDDKYLEQVKNAIGKHSKNNISYHGECYGVKKHEALLNADAFILPSYSEGLPMAVLEAWAYGLPTLLTAECNLPEGFSHGASKKIHLDPQKLLEELKLFFLTTDEGLEEMSIAAQKLVEENYLWNKIGRDMKERYTEAILNNK